jgi:hypothetical protein
MTSERAASWSQYPCTIAKNSGRVHRAFSRAISRFASSTYAKEETGRVTPPATSGKLCREEEKGAMEPSGLTGSIFHHIKRSSA